MSPADFADFFTVVGVHLHDTADTLLLAAHRVVDAVALREHARVDAHEGQLAHERVGHQLECQGRELLVVVRLAGRGRFVFRHASHRRDVQRRGHVFDDSVEHGLHALVLEGRAAQHRLDFACDGALAQGLLDLFLAQLAAFEVLVHQVFAGFGSRFDELFAVFVADVDQVGGNVAVLEGHALVLVPDDRLHLHEVDDALEVLFGADRDLDHDGVGLQAVDHHLAHAQEVGAGAVHLVDEREAGHLVLVGLAPDGFRLGLHAADGVVHHHGAVQHAHRALDFNGEVHVAGGVDDVDAVFVELAGHALPEAGGGSRGDGDAALLLLLHPVHRGGAVVHFTDLVVHTGVEQDAFGRRGLASVDVRGDADVAVALDGGLAGHDLLSG